MKTTQKCLKRRSDRFDGLSLEAQVEMLKAENEVMADWIEWTSQQVQKLSFQAQTLEETLLLGWSDVQASDSKQPTQDE